MIAYHKIQTVWLRDPGNNHKTLLEGQWAKPEFEYLADNRWVFTEKVDGTNIRAIWNGREWEFRGKTDNAQIPPMLLKALAAMFDGKTAREPLTLYGEGYGARIQKGGGNYRPDQSFVLFDVKAGDWWLNRDTIEALAEDMGLDVTPIVGEGTLNDAVDMVQDGFDSVWGSFPAEGIVARPAIELKARNGDRIITKIKCKDFARQTAGGTR